MVRIGQKVEEFQAQAFVENDIRKIALSDYAGKWLVLIFYPADFTFVCPTELEQAAELYPEFQQLDAEVLSVSTDTVWVHKAWHDASPTINKITFPMVADPTAALSRQFGTYLEDEGVSVRGSFLIDPDGVLVALEMNDNSVGRNIGELLRKLQAAAFVRDHEGQVCPARWQPGENTLRPNLDEVGKI